MYIDVHICTCRYVFTNIHGYMCIPTHACTHVQRGRETEKARENEAVQFVHTSLQLRIRVTNAIIVT